MILWLLNRFYAFSAYWYIVQTDLHYGSLMSIRPLVPNSSILCLSAYPFSSDTETRFKSMVPVIVCPASYILQFCHKISSSRQLIDTSGFKLTSLIPAPAFLFFCLPSSFLPVRPQKCIMHTGHLVRAAICLKLLGWFLKGGLYPK